MKKYLLIIGLTAFILLSWAKVLAQTTEPGTNLPLLPGDTATTDDTYATATTSAPTYSTLTTATAAVVTYTTSAVSTTQTAVDDADTGSEFIFLAILSLTGGIGLFLIKKYFDFKRYSL